jgi:hypothetical protein
MDGTLAFYATAAQVLPVLLLAMVVGRDVYAGLPDHARGRVPRRLIGGFGVCTLVCLALGEALALYGIAQERSSPVSTALIGVSLVGSGGLVILRIAIPFAALAVYGDTVDGDARPSPKRP